MLTHSKINVGTHFCDHGIAEILFALDRSQQHDHYHRNATLSDGRISQEKGGQISVERSSSRNHIVNENNSCDSPSLFLKLLQPVRKVIRP